MSTETNHIESSESSLNETNQTDEVKETEETNETEEIEETEESNDTDEDKKSAVETYSNTNTNVFRIEYYKKQFVSEEPLETNIFKLCDFKNDLTLTSSKIRHRINLTPEFNVVSNEHNIVYDTYNGKTLLITGSLIHGILVRNNKHGLPILISLQWLVDNVYSVYDERKTFALKETDEGETKNTRVIVEQKEILYSERKLSEDERPNLCMFFRLLKDNKLFVKIHEKKQVLDLIPGKNRHNLVLPADRNIKINSNTHMTIHYIVSLKIIIENENILLRDIRIRLKSVDIIHIDSHEYAKNDELETLLEKQVPVDIAIKTCETSMSNMNESDVNMYYIKLFKKYQGNDLIPLYEHILECASESLVTTIFEYITNKKNEIDLQLICSIIWNTVNSQHCEILNVINRYDRVFHLRDTFELNHLDAKLPTLLIEYKYNFVHNLINHPNTPDCIRIMLMTSITPVANLKIIIESGLCVLPSTIEDYIIKSCEDEQFVEQGSNGLLEKLFQTKL